MKVKVEIPVNEVVRDFSLNRDELLNYAMKIAEQHVHIGTLKGCSSLLKSVKKNSLALEQAQREITEYVERAKDSVPAAEWFLDNYYLLKDLRLEINKNLPRRYERKLLCLATGEKKGMPRVYILMRELVKHADSQLSGEALRDFINAYQKVQPLTSGELWAIPIMLKIILLDTVRLLVEEILFTQKEREKATAWLEQFIQKQQVKEGDWQIELGDNFKEGISSAYAERLLQRIRDWGVDAKPLQQKIDLLLSKQALSLDGLAHREHQNQAQCQVSMSHAILSIRYLAEKDWPRFFEDISLVQKMLEGDPAGIYSRMDFESRDYYRHKVERVANEFQISELVVVQKILEQAAGRVKQGRRDRAHIGFDLFDVEYNELKAELKKEAGGRPKFWLNLKGLICNKPNGFYFGGITLLTILLFYALAIPLLSGVENWGQAVFRLLVLLIPVLGLAILTMNWLVTSFVTPAFLPRLVLSEGITSDYRTMVVIPTLLPSVERVQELLDQLEVYYLANTDQNLYFALLGDFVDAAVPELEQDKEIIAKASQGINALNAQYQTDAFFFFHRQRLWNSSENAWMGWERKRGKLIEFNRLLQGISPTSYTVQIGKPEILPEIRYVLTLDADTDLPRGSAKKLIGTMAHPLHTPHLDAEGRRVVKGYGVLQPRIGVSVLGAQASYFARLYSGKTGIDPYTTAVSDVYQDLFGEGSFTGKGIYDLKVFHQVTGEAFPENQILSHDLIEGIYARAGLVTDIELIDGYPAKYQAYMRRLHRWTRGDWQILPWLLRDLPFQAKWRIFDNLRRSLEAPSQILLLWLAFTVLPQNPWFWVLFIVLGIFFPSLLQVGNQLAKGQAENLPWTNELKEAGLQGVFHLATLPFQAYLQVDAILRSLIRQGITRKKLLEWETAADAEKRIGLSLGTSLRLMWPVWGIVIFFSLGIYAYAPSRLISFLVLGLLWAISPWLAYRLSLPIPSEQEELTGEQKRELRKWSRQIWAFFETYVSAEENWLPPDNVQMNPPNGIAHRTSPTNIGLAILANRAARDGGYLTLTETLRRVEGTLGTLEGLAQWNGHFYNWYDTQTLEPLEPKYVSTVDSGNLAVSLLTLDQGLKDLLEEPIFSENIAIGFSDTYELLREAWGEQVPTEGISLAQKLGQLLKAPQDLQTLQRFFAEVALPSRFVCAEAKDPGEAEFWFQVLARNIAQFQEEFRRFFPYPELCQAHLVSKAGDLRQLTVGKLHELYVQVIEQTLSKEIKNELTKTIRFLEELVKQNKAIQQRVRKLVFATDFRPLYNPERQLFSIGYRINEGELDRSFYDLLASEARMASFIAIAKGDVPQSHWFRLGRTLTLVNGQRSLVSWSGTMFEFLMPLLVMRNFPRTLWDETYQAVLEIQRQYGKKRKIPWGISESGYYLFDPQQNYQYKAFGVPGLGLKRGLLQELVVAPYASFLALQVSPSIGLANLSQMAKQGFTGRYGFFEAIDYTRERIPLNKDYQIIQSYMVHHQGMSLIALNNVLMQERMQKRFHREPMVQATELLLQERVPKQQMILPPPEVRQLDLLRNEDLELGEDQSITYKEVNTVVPLTHFVANGEYSVMLTNGGSGFSRYKGMAITRWREDVTRDHWGMYFYIQNLNSGDFWSATYQPCRKAGDDYQVTFAPDRVEYARKDGNIVTKLEVVVSPEDPVEIRRISLTNHSSYERELEITSYFETVLTRPNDDLAHPAFSNLFIQTEFTHQALLASRRPRRPEQGRPWLMHTVTVEGEDVGALQYETDRAKFLGRGGSLFCPRALEINQPLSNTVGAVLNPIMSLRKRVVVKPGKTVRVTFSTGSATNREEAIHLAEKYQDLAYVQRAFDLAWSQSQMELKHRKISAAKANAALSLGGQILYLSPARREYFAYLEKNKQGQSSLWPYAISGDLPLVMAAVSKMEHLEFVRQALEVHEYWQRKGLATDLIIFNEDETGYLQAFQDRLRDLIAPGYTRTGDNLAGGVFLLQKSHIPEAITNLLYSVARLVFHAEKGSFDIQLRKKAQWAALPHEFAKEENDWLLPCEEAVDEESALNRSFDYGKNSSLLYFNGLGGFTEDGKEYVIELKEGIQSPAPWINVIANPSFGFLISESGAGYTWSQNSRENKLTPWSNDPILDPSGEGIYLRDEENGKVWSPTAQPIREKNTYTVRHGQGYSHFSNEIYGIKADCLVYVPLEEALKIGRIALSNNSARKRKLSVTYYAEFVLGVAREQTAPFIVTEFEEGVEALLARNTYQEEFAGRVAFLSGWGGELGSYTGDREEWLGRNGDLSAPQGMKLRALSKNCGAGFDPCGAVQRVIELEPGEEKEVVFFLGEGKNREDALQLVNKFKDTQRLDDVLQEVGSFWDNLLGTLQVRTPEKSMDILLNRWLNYQTIACRIWSRSAFYQSGGAFGFRDQLQDVMSLSVLSPGFTKRQIIRHCGHQFREGDVQHWWHTETSKGVRTKFTDDLLWLPFVTADYLEHTKDYSLLDEVASYLTAEPLKADEDERYTIPQISEEQGTVYEHCIRAIEHGLKFGEHGLPLIGSGDWNDGFSRIGIEGKGESVWLGWFIITTLNRFASVCDYRQDNARAERYRLIALELKANLEKAGWDGGWYRRAYFDDGTPLGSGRSEECQIDAIAQSWSVISGGARESRAKEAMLALENYLWKKEDGILLLLTPPFERSQPDPGYIQGYVPGVRENGGQYTHGATWAILAFAALGEGNKAAELFNMLNPINHTRTPQEVARYKVEPYVMAADVYAIHPHTGRGGWTWYTGAAGWMYQAGLEGILGFLLKGDELTMDPCIPSHWPQFALEYRYKATLYHIQVENPQGQQKGVKEIFLDGEAYPGFPLKLVDDQQEHQVRVIL